jgi:AcrR family transcriptional regulator
MVKATLDTKLADAALKLLAKKPWRDLTLAEVAKTAKIALSSLQSLGGKAALIGLILQKFGAETASHYVPEKNAGVKDRVLEAAMAWFEVNARRKPAIRSLYNGLKFDPLSLIEQRDAFASAAAWLLTLAQADTGPAMPLRTLGLAAIIGRAIGVWLDDGADMAKTMARLDGDLSRAADFLRPRGTPGED